MRVPTRSAQPMRLGPGRRSRTRSRRHLAARCGASGLARWGAAGRHLGRRRRVGPAGFLGRAGGETERDGGDRHRDDGRAHGSWAPRSVEGRSNGRPAQSSVRCQIMRRSAGDRSTKVRIATGTGPGPDCISRTGAPVTACRQGNPPRSGTTCPTPSRVRRCPSGRTPANPRDPETSLRVSRRQLRSVSPRRIATAAASTRPDTPSLARMFPTWTPTVLRVMNRRSPISGFVRPWASRRRTSRSRALSPNVSRRTDDCRRRGRPPRCRASGPRAALRGQTTGRRGKDWFARQAARARPRGPVRPRRGTRSSHDARAHGVGGAAAWRRARGRYRSPRGSDDARPRHRPVRPRQGAPRPRATGRGRPRTAQRGDPSDPPPRRRVRVVTIVDAEADARRWPGTRPPSGANRSSARRRASGPGAPLRQRSPGP